MSLYTQALPTSSQLYCAIKMSVTLEKCNDEQCHGDHMQYMRNKWKSDCAIVPQEKQGFQNQDVICVLPLLSWPQPNDPCSGSRCQKVCFPVTVQDVPMFCVPSSVSSLLGNFVGRRNEDYIYVSGCCP